MKRYKIVADIGPDDAWEKYEIDNGEWIKYEDHVAILAVAKEALGFYAERNNYIGGESYEIGIDENKLVMHPVPRVPSDSGNIAREALAKIEEMEK